MKPRILLLEDDLVLRDFLASSLMSANYEVIRVAQPKQALTLMDMTPFELAIFDGRLPDMNGVEVMEEARSRGFEGKFILISASPEKFLPPGQERRVMGTLGILKVFKKPFPFNDLVDFIEELGQSELKDLSKLATDDSLTLMTHITHEAKDDQTVVSPVGAEQIELSTQDSGISPGLDLSNMFDDLPGSSGLLEGSDLLAQLIDESVSALVEPKPETKPGERPLSLYSYDAEPASDGDLSTNAFLPSAHLVGLGDDVADLLGASAIVPAAPLSQDELAEVLPSSDLTSDISEVSPQATPEGAPEDPALTDPEALPQVTPEIQGEAVSVSPDAMAQIAAARDAYGEKLERELCELVRTIGLIRRRSHLDVLDDVIQRSHRLHGTSATFGFAEIAEISAWFEALFGEVRDGHKSLSGEHWDEIYDNAERALLSQHRFRERARATSS